MDLLNQRLSAIGSRVGAAVADGFILFGVSFIARWMWDYSLWNGITNAATRDALSARGSLFFYAGGMTRIWPYSGQWWISMIALSAVYFVGCHYWAGATLGKRAFGLRVVASDGSRVSLIQATVRYLGYWISSWLWGLGYLPIVWGGRPLHDRIADTAVIEVGNSGDTRPNSGQFRGHTP